MAKEITTRVRKIITNLILRNVDGLRFKKVDEYHLHQIVATVTEEAVRPDSIEIRK